MTHLYWVILTCEGKEAMAKEEKKVELLFVSGFAKRSEDAAVDIDDLSGDKV